jgi:dolichol-phosphate mannosyltransferase
VPASLDLSVIVPAHNEGPNLQLLLPQLRAILDGIGIESEVLVVVRDEDPQTRAAAAGGQASIVRQREPGYGGALRTGFAQARGRHVLTMDADLSHPPTFVADLWAHRDEAEVLVASRYVPGGAATMPLLRALLSRILNRVFARGLGVPLEDLSSGFRLYRTSVLDMWAVTARDFDVLPEIVVRAHTEGWRVKEIPFHYEPRAHGSSNARIIPFGLAYARTFRRLWALRNSVLSADYEDRAFDSWIPLQRFWQRQRRRHVASFLEPGRRTLDVGCGSSRILAALPERSVGVDLLIRKLRHARRFGRPLVQASALALPFRAGSFECVVSSQLLEALPRGTGALAEMGRVLVPGGRLILATPDHGRRLWLMLAALYQRLVPGAGASPNRARYTRRELIGEIAGLGYELEATRSILGAELILAFRKAGPSSSR